MRAALLLLLLINLAFFAWAQWLAPEEAPLPVSPKVDAPRLQLAHEAQPVASGNGRCVTVGPFATNELAARARQTLSDSGYESLQKHESANVAIDEGYLTGTHTAPTSNPPAPTEHQMHPRTHHQSSSTPSKCRALR